MYVQPPQQQQPQQQQQYVMVPSPHPLQPSPMPGLAMQQAQQQSFMQPMQMGYASAGPSFPMQPAYAPQSSPQSYMMSAQPAAYSGYRF